MRSGPTEGDLITVVAVLATELHLLTLTLDPPPTLTPLHSALSAVHTLLISDALGTQQAAALQLHTRRRDGERVYSLTSEQAAPLTVTPLMSVARALVQDGTRLRTEYRRYLEAEADEQRLTDPALLSEALVMVLTAPYALLNGRKERNEKPGKLHQEGTHRDSRVPDRSKFSSCGTEKSWTPSRTSRCRYI